MKRKWIKTPDNKFIKKQPDKLKLFLTGNEHLLAAASAEAIDTVEDFQVFDQQGQSQYHTNSFDSRKLASSEITVLGGGAVGSHMAYYMAPAQPILHIIDYKNVEAKHIHSGRTIYEYHMIDLMKVEAAKQKIEQDYPGTIVHPYPYDVAEIPDSELIRLFQRSLVVILAIDDPRQMLRVSDLTYSLVEMIHVAMHAQALSGHIVISVPFVTPCLRCTLDITSERDIHRLDGEPGSSWHIRNVAHQAATIAIDIMYSKITGRDITRWNTTKNLNYISNSRQELSPDGPGLRFEGSRKRPGCPICNP